MQELSTASTEAQLIHLRTDISNTEYDVRLGLDVDGRATEIHYSDGVTPAVNFDTAKLTDGLVLMRKGGRDIVTLSSKNFDPRSGGPVTMTYLYNGISGGYRTLEMEIDRIGNDWRVYRVDAAGRQLFQNMFLRKNSQFPFGVIGILSIETSP